MLLSISPEKLSLNRRKCWNASGEGKLASVSGCVRYGEPRTIGRYVIGQIHHAHDGFFRTSTEHVGAHRRKTASFTEFLKGASDRGVLTPPLSRHAFNRASISGAHSNALTGGMVKAHDALARLRNLNPTLRLSNVKAAGRRPRTSMKHPL